jgi:hypothetical protein
LFLLQNNTRPDKKMDPVSRTTAILLGFVGAAFTAITLGYVAHYDMGLTRDEIRTPSLVGAFLIGILMATEYFGKKLRKPK